MSYIRLFDADATSFDGLGLGLISDCETCKITEERNGEFELEMTYPVTGVRMSQLALRELIVVKPNPYDSPQAFRIYSITKEFEGMVTVNAQHISYDLSDIIIRKGSVTNSSGIPPADIWNQALKNLAAGFSIGNFKFSTNLTGSDSIDIIETDDNNNTTTHKLQEWTLIGPKSVRGLLLGTDEDGITKNFIGDDDYGDSPEFLFDNFNIKLLKSRGENRGVTIRYGKNMTGFSQEESLEKIYTHVYPYYYADSINYYSTGYGNSEQATKEHFMFDLSDWSGSQYTSSPLIETGIKDADGKSLSFKKILMLDCSQQDENAINLQKASGISLYSGRLNAWLFKYDGEPVDKLKIKAETTVEIEVFWDFDNVPGVYTNSDGVGGCFDMSEHYSSNIEKYYALAGDTAVVSGISDIVSYKGTCKITNNSTEAITIGEAGEGYWIFSLSGDNTVDVNTSYYYNLDNADDISYGAQQLEAAASRYISKNHMSQFPVSLSVDMVMLPDEKQSELKKIKLCDTVTVIYPKFNVKTEAKCTKTVYNALTERYESLDFSNFWSELSFTTASQIDKQARAQRKNNYISPELNFLRFCQLTH